MSFCDIRVRRTSDNVEVIKEDGQKSVLFEKLKDYTQSNDVYSGREWFFGKLIEQKKLQSTDSKELALGLYSIAFHSQLPEEDFLNDIEQLLPPIQEVVLSVEDVESQIEFERQSILKKYGLKGSEINPNAEWGKLVSAIADVNKKYGKVLNLYQSPASKWYLRVSKDDIKPIVQTKSNGQMSIDNAQQFGVETVNMESELKENWSGYFPDYSYLNGNEIAELADLVKQGHLEIICKL